MTRFITALGGRKFATMVVSLILFTSGTTYLLLTDTPDKAGIIVAIATGLTMISGAYFAGNVAQKNKEI